MSGAPAPHGMNVGFRVGDVLSGAAWGVVGSMAMTGMRVITTELGLVEQTPPEALSRQRARGVRALLRRAPRKQQWGLVEAAHWAFGAGGGAAFGTLPRAVRRRPWAGPAYGLVVWLGFELGIAPVLGLSQAKRARLVDRLALADHLLYGLVLSATRPKERASSRSPRTHPVHQGELSRPGRQAHSGICALLPGDRRAGLS